MCKCGRLYRTSIIDITYKFAEHSKRIQIIAYYLNYLNAFSNNQNTLELFLKSRSYHAIMILIIIINILIDLNWKWSPFRDYLFAKQLENLLSFSELVYRIPTTCLFINSLFSLQAYKFGGWKWLEVSLTLTRKLLPVRRDFVGSSVSGNQLRLCHNFHLCFHCESVCVFSTYVCMGLVCMYICTFIKSTFHLSLFQFLPITNLIKLTYMYLEITEPC